MLFTIRETSEMGHLIEKAVITKIEMADVKPAGALIDFVEEVAYEMANACEKLGASERRLRLIRDTTSISFAFGELIGNKYLHDLLSKIKNCEGVA